MMEAVDAWRRWVRMQPPGEAPPHLPGHPQLPPGLPSVPYSEHLPTDGPSTHGNSWAGAISHM